MNQTLGLTNRFQGEIPPSEASVRHVPFNYMSYMGFSPQAMDAVIRGDFRVSDPEYLFFDSIVPVQRMLFEGVGDFRADPEDFALALQFKKLMHTVCEEIGQSLAQFEDAVEQLKTGSFAIYNPGLKKDIEDLRNGHGFLVPELEMARALRAYCEGRSTLRDV